MKDWFSAFEKCLDGEAAPSDLIGAGTATSERAMSHYRFQHEAKYREAVEDTFPVLIRYLGDEWENTWRKFRSDNEESPRSLDWVSGVFASYFAKSSAPLWQKELARFEHLMEVHPWTHRALRLKEGLTLSENCRVILGKYELVSFESPVTEIYGEEEVTDKEAKENVLLWLKDESVYFRPMQDWELQVLTKMPEGVEAALEFAPDDEELVGEFFQWLGSSHLIQDIKQD